MTAARKSALFEDTNEGVPSIDAPDAPAQSLIVDAKAAEIIAASAAAAETIGIFAYASFPIAIDPKTPAIARLRQIAQNGDSLPLCEALMFRIGGKLRPTNFRISRPDAASPAQFVLEIIEATDERPGSIRADEKAAAAVAQSHGNFADEAEVQIVRTQSEPSADAAPQGDAEAEIEIIRNSPQPEAKAQPRTDADTLKEIAERIREGIFEQRSAAEAAKSELQEPQESREPQEPAAEDVKPPAAAPASHPPRRSFPTLDPDHLARLAHELKTPLTAISAAAEVMRDERLGKMGNERYLAYASDIYESAHHALDVIASLLSESGRPGEAAGRLVALDLNAIVTRTVSSVQALAETHGLSLAFEADKSQLHIVANPTAIRQILLNLLTNAIKFTPPGGDIRVVTGYLDDGRVFLVVRDTGCGMSGRKPEASRAAGHPAPQEFAAGMGIGLPLVRRLVSEMGADLEIDSTPGKGTVVLVAFGGHARWNL